MDRGGEKERDNKVKESRAGGRKREKDVWDVDTDGVKGWRGENRRMEVKKIRKKREKGKETAGV